MSNGPDGNAAGAAHPGRLRIAPPLAGRIRYEPLRVHEHVDAEKRYLLAVDSSFPLAIKLCDFPAGRGAIPMTWHERLEIFAPLSGRGAFRIGEHVEPFRAGDILLIDNLRLHGVDTFDGRSRRGLVIAFYSDLVAPPGALPCDMWFLRPFHHLGREGCLRLRCGESRSDKAWECLSRLVELRLAGTDDAARQARLKLAFLDLLLVLEGAFRDRISGHSDYESRRDRLRRLAPVFDFLAANLGEPLTVPAAARAAGMSSSYFMRFFRMATGLTFARYLEQLRVSRAYQLLTETDLPLSRIAAETGFCDQCHLSHRMRRRFGTSPGRIRARHRAGAGP